MPEPGPGQVRIKVHVAGVSPTDPKIRRGDLTAVFPQPARAVLGFEAAGVVDRLGTGVTGVREGDEVASLLLDLGGYGEYAIASSWTPKPASVGWSDAASLPSSAEAAIGTLKLLGVSRGEILLILGAAGSVGMIATQLAVARGVTVIGVAAPRDLELVRDLGAVPISYGPGMADRVREVTASVDAVLDAAGKAELAEAVRLAGGPSRVVTLADEHASQLGVAFSVATPDRAPEALDQAMQLLAAGSLRLRRHRQLPMTDAAEAHRLLETGRADAKLVLEAP
ncbi:MAG TPA: NADP-dependent oxidoreductase [Acidimicrobiales bacterium]|jgi:NADPH:quinone reductase-like Zn-dependent oxidoreductase|nr:NADP-dependent oxidoreductase [Acidimicrobiales bacterium]